MRVVKFLKGPHRGPPRLPGSRRCLRGRRAQEAPSRFTPPPLAGSGRRHPLLTGAPKGKLPLGEEGSGKGGGPPSYHRGRKLLLTLRLRTRPHPPPGSRETRRRRRSGAGKGGGRRRRLLSTLSPGGGVEHLSGT